MVVVGWLCGIVDVATFVREARTEMKTHVDRSLDGRWCGVVPANVIIIRVKIFSENQWEDVRPDRTRHVSC